MNLINGSRSFSLDASTTFVLFLRVHFLPYAPTCTFGARTRVARPTWQLELRWGGRDTEEVVMGRRAWCTPTCSNGMVPLSRNRRYIALASGRAAGSALAPGGRQEIEGELVRSHQAGRATCARTHRTARPVSQLSRSARRHRLYWLFKAIDQKLRAGYDRLPNTERDEYKERE